MNNDTKQSKAERKLLAAHTQKMREKQLENTLSEQAVRARSLTVGTAFGGASEIMMRKPDGTVTFAILQPVEVIELIHQLAANVGCHLQLVPRKDFASWRDWKYTEEELAHYRGVQNLPGVGHPPHANDMAPHNQVGANLPPPEQQPGLQPALMAKEIQDEQAVATEKTL
jgi:hypothetical protein